MAYDLTFSNENNWLRIEISGIRESSELTRHAMQAWREMALATQRAKVDKLLIISSATGKYPALDALLINSSLGDCGVQRLWKIAFVNLDQASFHEVKFAETVAVNRGFNVGIFGNVEDARDWLMKSQ